MSHKKKYNRLFKTRRYTRESVMKDREYGLYWYDWLWHILRPTLSVICALLVVVGLVSTAWNKVYDSFLAPVDGADASTYAFTISSGESVTKIGQNLESQGFIRNDALFKYYVQFYGLTNKFQSGVYYVSKDLNLFEMADALTSGIVTTERTIRILPGWNVEDIADYLVSVGALGNRETFLRECRDYRSYMDYSLALIDADGNKTLSARSYPLEGYLAPDTYRIYLTADAASIVRTLVKQMDTVYTEVFNHEYTYDENGDILSEPEKNGAKGVVLTDDDIFIMASVIEKEAANTADMKRVAAVFYNRLAAGMKLQSDPTATYLTNVKRLALTDSDILHESLYNTYLYSGLPVGPICNPSRNALLAALYPDEEFLNDNYLYFCAAEPGSGKLVFAQTADEHEANVAYYRPMWEEYDRQQLLKNKAAQ